MNAPRHHNALAPGHQVHWYRIDEVLAHAEALAEDDLKALIRPLLDGLREQVGLPTQQRRMPAERLMAAENLALRGVRAAQYLRA